jgi:hypothetical protein
MVPDDKVDDCKWEYSPAYCFRRRNPEDFQAGIDAQQSVLDDMSENIKLKIVTSEGFNMPLDRPIPAANCVHRNNPLLLPGETHGRSTINIHMKYIETLLDKVIIFIFSSPALLSLFYSSNSRYIRIYTERLRTLKNLNV